MFRLALLLHKSIDEIEHLSSREISEWIAYDRINPLPDPWLQTGVIAATQANCHRSKGKPYKPGDFTPQPRTEAPQADVIMTRMLSAGLNVTDQRE